MFKSPRDNVLLECEDSATGVLFSIPSSLRSSTGKILPTPGTFHSVQRLDIQSVMAREAARPAHPWTKNHLAQNVNNGRGWGTQVWSISIPSSVLYGYWALNKCSRNKGMNKSVSEWESVFTSAPFFICLALDLAHLPRLMYLPMSPRQSLTSDPGLLASSSPGRTPARLSVSQADSLSSQETIAGGSIEESGIWNQGWQQSYHLL